MTTEAIKRIKAKRLELVSIRKFQAHKQAYEARLKDEKPDYSMVIVGIGYVSLLVIGFGAAVAGVLCK